MTKMPTEITTAKQAIVFLSLLVPLLGSVAKSSTAATARDFEAQHRQLLEKNPPGVNFTLRLPGGKVRFHPGEIIPLELAFSSTLPKTYTLDAATYDRSGRLPNEQFHLDPSSGVVDPYDDYYHSGGGFFGGGLRGMPTLSDKPVTIPLTLNEWLRFDQPGTYRLYDVSTRLIDQRAPGDAALRETPVTSNVIEFEILPRDAAWEQQTLAEAVRTLGVPRVDAGEAENHRIEARQQAARVVRFLGTPEAVREMVGRLSNDAPEGTFDYHMGLFGTPHRALVVQEMESQLLGPEQPVTASFLNTLAQLKMLLEYPEPITVVVVDQSGKVLDAPWKQQQEEYRQRSQACEALLLELWQRLTGALDQKRGSARATSLHTLLSLAWSRPRVFDTPAFAVQLKALQPQLIGMFEALPAETQATLLESYQWPRLKSLALLPALRRLYARRPASVPGSAGWASREVIRLSLRRIYELAPVEGRPLILQEIKSSRPRFRMDILGLLPDKPLPELDAVLAKNLEDPGVAQRDDPFAGVRDFEIVPQLIARYASAAILPRVKRFYGDPDRGWSCETQAALLAYFLRTAPAYGADMVSRALAMRRDTRCYSTLLQDVAQLRMNADVERIAVAHLSDADAEVATSAANVLGQYGSSRAEAPLWQRLRQWHTRWKGRSEELRYRPGAENRLAQQGQLEVALVHALAENARWLTDKSKLQQLRDLAVTTNARQEVERALSQWQEKIRLSFSPDSQERWLVAQYEVRSMAALEAKLAQFPRGTTFLWRDNEGSNSKIQPRLTDLQAFLQKRGMRLEMNPELKPEGP
jgi:hypothetical protein